MKKKLSSFVLAVFTVATIEKLMQLDKKCKDLTFRVAKLENRVSTSYPSDNEIEGEAIDPVE